MDWKKIFFAAAYLAAIAIVLVYAVRQVILREQKIENKDAIISKIQTSETTPPSKLIDLKYWKLTLPIDGTEDSELPMSVEQPQLENFSLSPWFETNKEKNGVIFRAPVNAPTTRNSDYPRSELRETEYGKSENAFWSSVDGKHTMSLDQTITALPQKKRDIVAGQIHGDDDDIVTVRLEDRKLYIARSKSNLCILDEKYSLGKRFSIKFVAENGKIDIFYNNNSEAACSLEKKVSKAYFKAGAYTQSNCKTEVDPKLCTSKNYGEVIIYKAEIKHE